jgi:hypothetical protein
MKALTPNVGIHTRRCTASQVKQPGTEMTLQKLVHALPRSAVESSGWPTRVMKKTVKGHGT